MKVLVDIVKSLLQLEVHSSLDEAVETSLNTDATYAQHYTAALRKRTGMPLISQTCSPICKEQNTTICLQACLSSGCAGDIALHMALLGKAWMDTEGQCHGLTAYLPCCSTQICLTTLCTVYHRADQGRAACSKGKEGRRRGHHWGRGSAACCELSPLL